MDFVSEAKKIAAEVSEKAKKSQKVSAFAIYTTKNIRNKGLFFPPLRHSPQAICANVVVYSQNEAVEIAKAVDGTVDIILVDAEEKIVDLDLLNIVRKHTKKSKVMTFKTNDSTADATDALISQLIPELNKKKAAIIGAGNLGSKIALKLLDRGVDVVITRTNEDDAKKISDGLNLMKPKSSKSFAVGMNDNIAACENADIVIGATQGIAAITSETVEQMNPNGIIVDAGIGTVTPEAIELANTKGIKVFRVDMRSGFAGAMTNILETENFLEKVFGSKVINGIRIVAGGFIGKRGDIIVDNISKPTNVIGIADGFGRLIESDIPEEFLKNLKIIQQKIRT